MRADPAEQIMPTALRRSVASRSPRRREPVGAPRPIRLVWDPRFLDYDLGPGHPFDERSRALAVDLFEGSLAPEERRSVDRVSRVALASPTELARFHSAAYLAAVSQASEAGDRRLLDAGDTPSFPGCWEASRRVVGATASAVLTAVEDHRSSVVLAGGLHHAAPERASGFCILNDLGVAIALALERGARVAYVDLDAHHGDGVGYGFYRDGRLLDVDFHQDGRTLFPGTGAISEVGAGDGAGLKVNVPFPPGAGDEALVPTAGRLLPSLFETFRPDLLVLQHGVDGHWGDPLARLQYTPAGYAAVDRLALRLAGERGIPFVLTGGGGYRAESVSRVLAGAARLAAGLPLPADDARVPEPWADRFQAVLGAPPPQRWVDPPRLRPSPWNRALEDETFGALERALGRRFPRPDTGPAAARAS